MCVRICEGMGHHEMVLMAVVTAIVANVGHCRSGEGDPGMRGLLGHGSAAVGEIRDTMIAQGGAGLLGRPLLARMRLRGGRQAKRGEEEEDEEEERGSGIRSDEEDEVMMEEIDVRKGTSKGKSGERGGGSGMESVGVDGGKGESKRGKSNIMYRPGGEMGMGSLQVDMPGDGDTEEESEGYSGTNATEIIDRLGENIIIKLGEEEEESEEGARKWRSDWWNEEGVTREDIMKYLRVKDPERTPGPNNEVELNEALATCSAEGDVDRIHQLVDAGAEVNAGGAGGSSQWTPLHHAAYNDQLEALVVLLGHGARPNVWTWARWTALHFACDNDNVEMAQLLLDKGADMYSINSEGDTPYDVADVDCKELLELQGYSTDTASHSKASVTFVAPQLPDTRDGELPNLWKITGDPDGQSQRINKENSKTAKKETFDDDVIIQTLQASLSHR